MKARLTPKPPNGYRIVKRGERVQNGDLGFLKPEWGWTELKNVIGLMIVHPGKVARKI